MDIAIDHAALQLDGAPHRLGRALEGDEQTIASRP